MPATSPWKLIRRRTLSTPRGPKLRASGPSQAPLEPFQVARQVEVVEDLGRAHPDPGEGMGGAPELPQVCAGAQRFELVEQGWTHDHGVAVAPVPRVRTQLQSRRQPARGRGAELVPFV